MTNAWSEDVLGPGFEQRTLPLEPESGSTDEEVVATLVRALPAPRRFWQRERVFEDIDVLYIHGWSDYFLQRRLARFWTDRGARFFALDLRRYGRSLREGQLLGYVPSLRVYDADIEAALDAMREHGAAVHRRLVLFGHSTGGLTLCLWANRNPGIATALVLNSPWLELQTGAWSRQAIAPVADLTGRLRPYRIEPQLDLGFYSRAQAESYDESDPYEINHEWRPERSAPVHAGWTRAIINGHARVASGLTIDVPICILISQRSTLPSRWTEALTASDSVLSVEDIARNALRLGSSVTIERIEGALHDVFLSRHEAREDAYARLARWTEAMLATPDRR